MPHVDDNIPAVWSMLSEPRMAPYLRITGNNQHDALSLYEWSTRVPDFAAKMARVFRSDVSTHARQGE